MVDVFPARQLLVVDDDQTTAEGLAQLLRLGLPGWRVGTAYDGRAAVERARHERPHAVVLDLEMPVLDGIAAAAALRAGVRGAALVLVAVSGSAPRLAAATATGLFNRVMPKPIDLARLEAFLSRTLPQV